MSEPIKANSTPPSEEIIGADSFRPFASSSEPEGSGAAPCSICRVCGEETPWVFNIKFKATPICESCANAITLQQVTDLVRQNGVDCATEGQHQ